MTIAALLLLAMLSGSPEDEATAGPAGLAARFEAGRDLFDQGRYAEAADVFSQLHAESGDAALLYPAAQSLRLAGRCAEALTAYQGFTAQSQLLRDRAQAVGSDDRLERLALDLKNASGRIVEMQACVGRSTAQGARARAVERRLTGDTAGALALLMKVWEQTNDATVLPELAELHRRRGACEQATTLLDLAVTSLSPIEALDEAGAEGSDIAAVNEALQRARTDRAGGACVPGADAQGSRALARAAQPPVAGAPAIGVVRGSGGPDVAKSPRPRWPLWVAGAGAGLALGGAVFLILAHQTESQVNTIRDMGWTPEGDRLISKGNAYDAAGLGLSIGGGAIAVGAATYYYVTAPRQNRAVPAVQVSRGAASFVWTGTF